MTSEVLVWGTVVVASLAATVGGAVVGRRWWRLVRLVDRTSAALGGLDRLNDEFRDSVRDHGTLKLAFSATMNSKARYDRFDLTDFMLDSLAERAESVRAEVERRRAAGRSHSQYVVRYDELARRTIGATREHGVDQRRFDRVERRRFARRKLRPPSARAEVHGSVSYTSPKGRNSYRRSIRWSFDELEEALAELVHRDSRRSRIDLERSLMTHSMRVDVLRRDGHRCRMCGRGAADIELHVDHIVPVSTGGKTTMDNLQVLCRDCNLGKSNRFVG